MITRLCNSIWLLKNLPAYVAMQQALTNPGKVQSHILSDYLRLNRNTQFGQQHTFGKLKTIQDFQNTVPLSQYDDYLPWIDRIRKGESAVLTQDRVTGLMPTSGSTTSYKLIPYTRTLQQEFNRGISAWVADLFLSRPDLMKGKAYWSISPNMRTDTDGLSAVPIGFQSDATYLGGVSQRLVESVLAVKSYVRHIQDIETFSYVTLLQLMACRDLRLISIWHPSYLLLLLDKLPQYWDSLLADLANGTIHPPQAMPNNLQTISRFTPNQQRATLLRAAGCENLSELWPHLGLISCWGDSHASESLGALQRLFEGVVIQEKGLIATEAFVTYPQYCVQQHPQLRPLSIRSHFFEFLDKAGKIYLADQLLQDDEYTVIVTTAGGLYRYQLKDKVIVTGFAHATPCLKFVGKEDSISDYYGEKLCDSFVTQVLGDLLTDDSFTVRYSMLAPSQTVDSTYYTLYIEYWGNVSSTLAIELEHQLRKNTHYDLCRRLGQLKASRIFRITQAGQTSYLMHCQTEGKNLGDIKPVKLSPNTGWEKVFTGDYLQ